MANTQVEKTQGDSTKVVRSEGERHVEQQPRERIPFGIPRSKLAVAIAIEGYHLHWINDSAGRIYEAQQGGYAFVSPEEVGAEGEDKVKKLVGKNEDGSPMFAYLMKIDLDLYEQDQKVLGSVQDQFDKAIKSGSLNEKTGENRYIPKGGISIKSK